MEAIQQNVFSIEAKLPLGSAEAVGQTDKPFGTLDSLVASIKKHQRSEEYIDEKLGLCNEDTLLKVFTRTKDILRAAVEYRPKVDDEHKVNFLASQEVMRYGFTVSERSFMSQHKLAETLGRYLAGYDTYLIACLQNVEHETVGTQIEQVMQEPKILADILGVEGFTNTENSIGRAALTLVVPQSQFDDISLYDLRLASHYIPPQHGDI